MVTSWMVIQSLSIARNPQELQVVTTEDLIVKCKFKNIIQYLSLYNI